MERKLFSLLLLLSAALSVSASFPTWYDGGSDTISKAENIIKHFGLEGEYSFCVETQYGHIFRANGNSKGNRDCPYHNLYHAQTMVKNCFEGAVYEGLDRHETGNLIAAALFHDFGHGCGMYIDDKDNIKRAVHGYTQACEQLGKKPNREVIELIEVTRFPVPNKPTDQWTLADKIIRDSDMLQALEPNWKEQVLLGLRKEFQLTLDVATRVKDEVKVKQLTTMLGGENASFVSWLKSQIYFFTNFWDLGKTNWGKELKALNKDHILKGIQRLIEEHTPPPAPAAAGSHHKRTHSIEAALK